MTLDDFEPVFKAAMLDKWFLAKSGLADDEPFYSASQMQQLIDQTNAKDAELAAARAEIERLKTQPVTFPAMLDDERAKYIAREVNYEDQLAARDLVIQQMRVAIEYKHDSVKALLEWCVKNVKKWDFPQYDYVAFAIKKTAKALTLQPSQEALDAYVAEYKTDAERYRWLLENCSYHYPMQPDSRSECGIEFQWQQGTYEERNWTVSTAIDAAISARKDK